MSDTSYEFEALRAAENYRRAVAREFRPWLGSRVLEVGSGVGQMTQELLRQPGVKSLLAIEPDAAFHAAFTANCPNVSLHKGTAHDLPAQQPWDSIVSVNVLEHIADDPGELAVYSRLLAPAGGHLCLLVPARPELYAPIDRDFGHHRRYTKAGLKAKLEQAGFVLHRLHYFNFVGYFAWGLNFRLLGQRRFNVAGVRMFDRFIFPPTNWLETHLLRPPIGQSLVAVGRAVAKQ